MILLYDVLQLVEDRCSLFRELSRGLKQDGLKRATAFSWEEAARQLVQVFEEAVSDYQRSMVS